MQDGGCFGDRPRPLGVWSNGVWSRHPLPNQPSIHAYDENALAVTKSGLVLGWTLLDATCSSGARGKAASEAREDLDEAWDSGDRAPTYVQAIGLKLMRCAY